MKPTQAVKDEKLELQMRAEEEMAHCENVAVAASRMFRAVGDTKLHIALVSEVYQAASRLAGTLAMIQNIEEAEGRHVDDAERAANEERMKVADEREQLKRIVEFCKQNGVVYAVNWTTKTVHLKDPA